ncbi:MAG: hypothetical protein WC807_20880 [Hyphomicrobium sp.]
MTYKHRPPTSRTSDALKIRLCGKDDVPLSMKQLRDGLYQAARELLPYEKNYRARSITLYLTVIDENGRPVKISRTGEIKIYPYKCAADDFNA